MAGGIARITWLWFFTFPEAAVLGRVDPQGSLLGTRVVRRHLVTKGSFYERLADHGHEVVVDDDFRSCIRSGWVGRRCRRR